MKKILCLLTAILMLVAMLSACTDAKEVDLPTLLADINSQFGFSDLKNIEDADMLNRYYQIDQNDVKQLAAELSTAASQYSEVVMVEAVDSDAVDRIAAILNNHLDAQLSTAKSYDAAQVSMIEACKVQQTGNYVYLVVDEKASDISAVIEQAMK